MSYSYWEIFYNPDIPLIERVGWATLSPVVIPGTAALAILSVGGCSTPSHEPLPFPKTEEKQRSFVRNKDAESQDTAHDIAPQDIYTCIPDPCPPDRIDMGRRKGDQALCISFSKSMLTNKGTHRAISVADINSDGLTDLYILNKDEPAALYMHTANNAFSDRANDFGLQLSEKSTTAIWADMDKDKDADLLLATTAGAKLYINMGNAFEAKTTLGDEPVRTAFIFNDAIVLGTENGIRFYKKKSDWHYEDATIERNLIDSGSANRFAVSDFDNDGDQDIYVANETGANRMFRNKGDGTFESVETVLHLDKPNTKDAPNPYGQVPSMDAQWVKTAHSDTPALYVANYGYNAWLFLKQSDGTYNNFAAAAGLHDGGNTVRAAWGNFLNESSPAVFLARTFTNDTQKDKQLSLLYIPIWDTSGKISGYRDIANPYGMSGPERFVGAEWGDYNGDGSLDLATAAFDGAVTVYLNESKWVKICP
jgi:hypothetical protein